jgi:hypothetical protein
VRPRVGSAGFCRGATNDAGACARHVVGNGAVAAGGGEQGGSFLLLLCHSQ